MQLVKRKCAKCGKPEMSPVERKMEIYNSVYIFKCENCRHEVELEPSASIGSKISLGLVLAFVVWGIFYFDQYNTATDWVIFAVVVSFLPGLALYQLWKREKYPVVEGGENVEPLELSPTQAITKKPVLWLEGLGMLGGLLAPLLFIIAFLGVAAIIGFINFSFFQ